MGENAKEILVIDLIQVILEGSLYQNSRDIIKASKILANLKVVDDKINIEDEDFKFFKQWAEVYPPVVNKGLMFADFYQQLEE